MESWSKRSSNDAEITEGQGQKKAKPEPEKFHQYSEENV